MSVPGEISVTKVVACCPLLRVPPLCSYTGMLPPLGSSLKISVRTEPHVINHAESSMIHVAFEILWRTDEAKTAILSNRAAAAPHVPLPGEYQERSRPYG